MISLNENFMGSMTRGGVNQDRGRSIGDAQGRDAQGRTAIQRRSEKHPSWSPKAPDMNPDGYIYKFCDKLRPEQQEIVRALNSSRSGNEGYNNDIYLSMGAGGGKTMPLFCYWLDTVLGLDVIRDRRPNTQARIPVADFINVENTLYTLINGRTNELPKLLFLVPTRALADQSARDFHKALQELMIQYFIKMITIYENRINNGRTIQRVGVQPNNAERTNMYRLDYSQFGNDNSPQRLFNEQYLNKLSAINSTFRSLCIEYKRQLTIWRGNYKDDQFKTIIRPQFFDQLKTLIIKHVRDRSELLVSKRDGEGTDGGSATSAIVTVSIYQSAPGIIKTLINNNLRLIICDEAHMNQFPTTDLVQSKQATQVATSLYKTLNAIKNKRIQLALLSGTIHPNAVNNFIQYLEKCYNRKFFKLQPFTDRNETPIESVANDSLSNPNNWVNLLAEHIQRRDYGVGFVMYSSKQIRILSEKILNATGTFNKGGQTSRTKFKRSDVIQQSDLKEDLTGEAAKIEDPLLRKCVSHGFAFFDGTIENNDKQIISKIFMDKQIAVVIATDGIGVGMNLAVKTLYLPFNEKWSNIKNRNETVPHRDLVQLINRLGRGKYPIAFVHTTSDDLALIDSAIIAGPNTFPDVKAIKHFKCGSFAGAKYFNSLFLNMVDWYDAYKDFDSKF